MALKTPFLAAEEPAVRRSRALHRFTVASPLMLLLSVGLVGHVRKTPSAQPAESPGFDRRILAYQPRVVAVKKLSEQEDPPLSEVRREASRWVAGRRSGELTPLPPAFFEDHLQTSVRGEAVRSGISLSSILASHAAKAGESGRVEEASKDALLSAQVAQGVRDFEPQTLLQVLLVQRRALSILSEVWPQRSPENRAQDAPALRWLLVPMDDLAKLRDLEKRQFTDYLKRQRITAADLVHGDLYPDSATQRQEKALNRSVLITNAAVAKLLKQ